MKTIKTWLATIALLLCSISANASDFEVNGLYYNILSAADRTVEMAGNGIYGDIIVPSNVKFNNIDFTVTRIGEYAFINGADIEYQITSVILPNTIKSIGSYAFQNCFSLKEIVIPEGVTRIEAGAFMHCGALEKIKLSTNISYIGEAAFQGCGISYIKLPRYCTIGANAFSSVSTVLLQPWGSADCEDAFGDNTLFIIRHEETPADFDGDGIDETTVPSYFNYMGSGMSKYYYNIVSYDPDFTNAEIDYILETGGMVTLNGVKYRIRSLLNTYTMEVFGSDYGITTADISSKINYLNREFTVTRIKESAFANKTALETVKIPNSITSIGNNAFAGCTALSKVTTESITPLSINDGCFDVMAQLFATLYVPVGAVETYKSATVWKGFGNIEAIANPSSTIDSGTYTSGETELTWEFTSDGELKIEGMGYIYEISEMPWAKYQNEIKKVFIGEGRTTIGTYAFKGCSNMTSIVISEGVRSISGIGPFEGCSSLTDITLPSTLEELWSSVLYNSKWYQEQPDGVIYLSNWLMGYKGTMPSNTTVNVADGTVGIAGGAFEGQTNLVGITIPDGIKAIGPSAFSNTSITSVSIPSSIEYLGGSSFSNCADLNNVSIPDVNNLKAVEAYAFDRTAWMNEKTDGLVYLGNWLLCYKGTMISNETITIQTGTVGIAGSAFSTYLTSNSQGLVSIVLPNSLKYIGTAAFQNCGGLTSIVIPEGVTHIGSSAFRYCGNLTTVAIPNSLKEIGGSAFASCNIQVCNINSVEAWCNIDFNDRESIPLSYPNGSMYLNGSLVESVTIPSSITKIKNFTFANNSKLTSVTIPEGVTSIGAFAFWRDYNIREINLPNSMIELSDFALSNTSITSITIGKNLTKIGNNPLTANPQLTSIIVKEGNEVYDSRNNCNALIHTESNVLVSGCRTTVIPDGVTAIGNAAFVGSPISSITIPETVRTIGSSAFETCTALETVEIKNGVEHIEANAFAHCDKLTSITLPESVQRIGNYAFYSSWNTLTSVTCKAQTPPAIEESTFYGKGSSTLYVPYNVLDDYKNAQYWSSFANIQAIRNDKYILDSESSFVQIESEEVTSITYTRTFNNTNWQALYVPFEIPVTEEFLADFEVADLNDVRQYDRDDDGVKDETVIEAFKVKSGVLEANYPYLIRAREAGEKTITVTDATLYATEENSIDCSSVREKFTFTGTYSQLSSEELPQGEGYYALSGGVWQPVAEGASLGAFRFYLKVDSRNSLNAAQGNAIRMRIIGEDGEEDDATRIDTSDFKNQKSELIFDLQGRRVENPTKGVYIVNGVKRVF